MRKCRHCKSELPPKKQSDKWQGLGWCDVDCMAEYGKAKTWEHIERKKRQERRERKRKLRTKSEATKSAQSAFNAYIRERDHDQPCISCGRTQPGGDSIGGTWDCGHYRSVGSAPELRFCELNAHRQCKSCNRDHSGRIVEYRINLKARIGEDALDWLEGPHEPKRYTIEELDELAAYYRKRVRKMKRERGT